MFMGEDSTPAVDHLPGRVDMISGYIFIGGKPMRYTVILEQEQDGGYVASVPALPGCVSQGDNRDEALSNIREAIDLYVEDCRVAGDPIPKEAGKEFIEVDATA